MKVIAQSTASTKVPYFHLAYLAATTRSLHSGFLTSGILMLAISCILLFKTTTKKNGKSLKIAHIIFRKMPVKKRVWCLLLLGIGVILLCFSFAHGPESYRAPWVVHESKLRLLGNELTLYQFENDDRLPKISRWCDELMGDSKTNYAIFQHPGKGPGRKRHKDKFSNYAINVNLASLESNEDLPADVVVLFESKEGWNQAGGPELINTDLGEKSGFFVYFGNGEVEYVQKEEIDNLRWSVKD